MPTLDWIGKKKVVNHHLDVPFRVLEKKYTYSADNKSQDSENKIIHGDNLEALKSLLPEYEGKIDCIYIDPPYNTGIDNGQQGWIYSDNVNDPRIKKWLGQVVGKENEDFTRHDKWLCMMYPRLKLLQKLLSEDGIIYISIDDIELTNLRSLCDEIFGRDNYVDTIIWKNKYGSGAKTIGFIGVHEYILIYGKNPISDISCELSKELQEGYNKKDAKYEERGGYFTQPLMTNSLDDRPNLQYEIEYNGDIIKPRKQWVWEKSRLLEAIRNDEVVFSKQKDGTYSVRSKQYLKDENGVMRKGKPLSIKTGPYTQDGTSEIEAIFGKNVFKFSKPSELISYLLSLEINNKNNKDYLILDSFAGSGTTAHAVLNMNKLDDGNRKFILIEMMDYAETITAERVKRVIQGYGDKEGTGGDFTYYELGQPLLINNLLNEKVDTQTIREYIWFTETGKKIPVSSTGMTDNPVSLSGSTRQSLENQYYLGVNFGAAYWFYYEKEKATTLDIDFLSTIKGKYEQYIIYADICLIPQELLQKNNIIFKKIPRDIKKF